MSATIFVILAVAVAATVASYYRGWSWWLVVLGCGVVTFVLGPHGGLIAATLVLLAALASARDRWVPIDGAINEFLDKITKRKPPVDEPEAQDGR